MPRLFPEAAPPSPAPASLEHLLERRQYAALRDRLADTRQALDPVSRDYFTGILANRENRTADSIRLLERILPRLEADRNSGRLRAVLQTLGDDDVKTFRYARAASRFAEMERRFGRGMPPGERQANTDAIHLFGLLRGVPPQRVTLGRSFTVRRAAQAPFHLPIVETHDGAGAARRWVLDTGASFSSITESAAKRLGVRLLPGSTVPVGSISGRPVAARLGVADTLHFGEAALQNVVFTVLPDGSLTAPGKEYRIDASLGFPALAALGSITHFRDGRVRFAPGTGNAPADVPTSAALYLDGLQPLVRARLNRDPPSLFTLDTGAQQTFLTIRYRSAHREDLARLPKEAYRMSGTAGARSVPADRLPSAHLTFADDAVVHLTNVPVLTVSIGEPQDSYTGNIGQNALAGFSAYTLDFSSMRIRFTP